MPVPSRPKTNKVVPTLAKIRRGEILGRYDFLTPGTRLFLFLRWLWTPYREMASLLPKKGKILDGGSGHGLLSLTLALQSQTRRVEGVDHSALRVSTAKKAARGLENLSFRVADYAAPSRGRYEGIAFIDVLHYLNYEKQEKVIRGAVRSLSRGGVLVFREVDRSPGLASAFNGFHEFLMTRLGFTRAEGLYFRTGPQWAALAEKSGIRISSRPTGRFPFADTLFWGKKN